MDESSDVEDTTAPNVPKRPRGLTVNQKLDLLETKLEIKLDAIIEVLCNLEDLLHDVLDNESETTELPEPYNKDELAEQKKIDDLVYPEKRKTNIDVLPLPVLPFEIKPRKTQGGFQHQVSK